MVSGVDRFCRFCGATLPGAPVAGGGDDALGGFRQVLNNTASAIDRAWQRAQPELQKASQETQRTVREAWTAAEPKLDSAIKSIDDALAKAAASRPVKRAKDAAAPAVQTASRTAHKAADKATQVTKPIVGKVAEGLETTARRVKERARRQEEPQTAPAE